ncbi:MAG: hypothetical protein WCD11_30035 [Solirubrobacteraceae bacterium]
MFLFTTTAAPSSAGTVIAVVFASVAFVRADSGGLASESEKRGDRWKPLRLR